MAPTASAELASPATGDLDEFEALVVSEQDVEFGHARTPRLPELGREHPCAAVSRNGGKIGFWLMALSIVLVVCHRGWQLPFFRPRSLVGLQENVCLPDEELFQGLCYMRCSILTNGNAPYRQSASECCKDSNFFCLFMGNTKSPYFGMGGGQSPPTTAAHAPKVGGICDADGHGSEESFNGLCYKKCSVLTGGKFPVRVNPTECCGGGTLECLSGKGNVSGNAEFGAGVHAPGEEKSEMTARSRMSMLCLPNEEEYLGNCYQKCSQLSEGKANKRVSPEGCCTCTPGPFEPLCCMWPFNVKTQPSYNVGTNYYGKTAPPHPPGFSVRCGDSEESFDSLCYKKCSLLTDSKMPHRHGPTKCCRDTSTNSTCADSPVLSKGGEKASGAVHGPYIRPHAARTPPTPTAPKPFTG